MIRPETAPAPGEGIAKAHVPAGWVTEGWLRQRARDTDGVVVAHQQFQKYLKWGMLPPGVGEPPRWQPEVLDQLLKIRRLGTQARTLARRAMLVHEWAPLPFRQLREAMIETAPTVMSPKRKMNHVDKAARWLTTWDELQIAEHPARLTAGIAGWRQEAGILIPLDRRPLHAPDGWSPPPPSEWAAVLSAHVSQNQDLPQHIDDSHFYGVAAEQYGNDARLEQHMNEAGGGQPYLDIPKEERIVLLTVRALALRHWQDGQQTGEQRQRQRQLLNQLKAR